MGLGLLLAFAGFAFVSSITPGPNNAMLLASGVNYGFRRTVPHIAGISLGCVAMVLLVGLGLEQAFAAVPQLYDVLRYTGAAYLLWLAWKIARAGPVVEGASGGRPMTFCQAAAFQWINPQGLGRRRRRGGYLRTTRWFWAQCHRARRATWSDYGSKYFRLGRLRHSFAAPTVPTGLCPYSEYHDGAAAGTLAGANPKTLRMLPM